MFATDCGNRGSDETNDDASPDPLRVNIQYRDGDPVEAIVHLHIPGSLKFDINGRHALLNECKVFRGGSELSYADIAEITDAVRLGKAALLDLDFVDEVTMIEKAVREA